MSDATDQQSLPPPRTIAAACAQIARFYGAEDPAGKARSCLWWMNRQGEGIGAPRRIQKEEVLGSPECMQKAIAAVMKPRVESLECATQSIKTLYFQCLIAQPK